MRASSYAYFLRSGRSFDAKVLHDAGVRFGKFCKFLQDLSGLIIIVKVAYEPPIVLLNCEGKLGQYYMLSPPGACAAALEEGCRLLL